jgi:tetrahydromethanopterin S-methyltransferase subunit D
MATRAQLRQRAYARATAADGAPAPSRPAAPAPSASEISRVYSNEMQQEEYTIQVTDTVEECFKHLRVISALVYVHGGVVGGVPAAAAADCYIGRTAAYLTELRAVGEQATPYLISETSTSEDQPARIFVKGAAGTKILIQYTTR